MTNQAQVRKTALIIAVVAALALAAAALFGPPAEHPVSLSPHLATQALDCRAGQWIEEVNADNARFECVGPEADEER